MASGISGQQILRVNYGIYVKRAAAVLPATATQTIFNVTNGKVLITNLVGEITTAASATATNLTVQHTTSAALGSLTLAMSSATAVTSLPLGALIGVPFASGSALITSSTQSYILKPTTPILQPGTLQLVTSATNTGAASWTLTYVPLDPGAVVTAA